MWGDKLSFKTETLGIEIHCLILISYGSHEQNQEHTTQGEEFYGYMTFLVDDKNPVMNNLLVLLYYVLVPLSEWLPNSHWPQWQQETNEA